MIERARRFVSTQLSRPSGRFGRLVAVGMNRGNRRMNEEAIRLLDVRSGTRVLDLGFGGGLTFPRLLDLGATVVGVDPAADMVVAAERSYREAIASGRLSVLQGGVPALPVGDRSVDRLLSINTVYFWPELARALGDVRRVIAPGGIVVLGIRDGAVMSGVSRDVFTIRPPEEIADALSEAGFSTVRVESPAGMQVHYIVGSAAA